MPVDTWTPMKVAIPSFAHPIRAGSALRISITSPGRDHGTWEFDTPDFDEPPVYHLGYGGMRASSLVLSTLRGITIAEGLPPCPSLRGQPCRAYEPTPNVSAP